MEACHQCFEPLQRQQRTPFERILFERVLVCSTCARKTRFLRQGMLRFLGRTEWLFNIYTSCAHCGFSYVTRVPSSGDAAQGQSLPSTAARALRLPTYTCDRCEESYADIRPPRWGAQPKPAAVAPRRVIRIRVPEVVIPDERFALPAGAPEFALGASRVLALPSGDPLVVPVAEVGASAGAAMPTEWETVASASVPLVIDVVPAVSIEPAASVEFAAPIEPAASVAAAASLASAVPPHTPFDDITLDDDERVAMGHGASVEPHQDQTIPTVAPDVVPTWLGEIRVDAPPARVAAISLPSLDVIEPLPALDVIHTAPALAVAHTAPTTLDVVHTVPTLDVIHTAPALDVIHTAPTLDVVHSAPALDVIHTTPTLDAIATSPALDEITIPTLEAITTPALEAVQPVSALDDARSDAAVAAVTERASRAVAERARLEALLAAFERHAANRRRRQAVPPARAPQASMTSTPRVFTPQTSKLQTSKSQPPKPQTSPSQPIPQLTH